MAIQLDKGLVAGRYQIETLLGRGGMGVVYRAWDLRLERWIALKILPEISDPTRIERFRREAKAIARLNHPNIVTLHDTDEAEGRPFLVMELIEGETLAIEAVSTTSTALHIAVQVAEALAYAHQYGVVHRDVKPQNIMLLADRRVKLLDFGLALFAGVAGLTGSGELPGTLLYLAPEQALGHRPDERSDQYSLALVLFQLLTKRFPWPMQSVGQSVYQRVHSRPAGLASLREDLPGQLCDAVDRALLREPAQRFAEIGQFRDALDEVLASLTTAASLNPALNGAHERPDGSVATSWAADTVPSTPPASISRARAHGSDLRSVHRTWLGVVVGAGIAGLLVLLFVGGLWLRQGSESTRRKPSPSTRKSPLPSVTQTADAVDKGRTAPLPAGPDVVAVQPRRSTVLAVASRKMVIRPVVALRQGVELVGGLHVSVNGRLVGTTTATTPVTMVVSPSIPYYIIEVRGDLLQRALVRRLRFDQLPATRLDLLVELKW